MSGMNRIATLLLVSATLALSQQAPPTPAQAINRQFAYVNQKVLDMAKDFPADKYDYRPSKDVRSFREVIIHIASGNAYGAKAGKGEKVNWDELDPKEFATKDAVVAKFQNSFDAAKETLKATPEERFTKTLAPWMSIIEHAAEHYGQLVVYYRGNGLVPPESRPKS